MYVCLSRRLLQRQLLTWIKICHKVFANKNLPLTLKNTQWLHTYAVERSPNSDVTHQYFHSKGIILFLSVKEVSRGSLILKLVGVGKYNSWLLLHKRRDSPRNVDYFFIINKNVYLHYHLPSLLHTKKKEIKRIKK